MSWQEIFKALIIINCYALCHLDPLTKHTDFRWKMVGINVSFVWCILFYELGTVK